MFLVYFSAIVVYFSALLVYFSACIIRRQQSESQFSLFELVLINCVKKIKYFCKILENILQTSPWRYFFKKKTAITANCTHVKQHHLTSACIGLAPESCRPPHTFLSCCALLTVYVNFVLIIIAFPLNFLFCGFASIIVLHQFISSSLFDFTLLWLQCFQQTLLVIYPSASFYLRWFYFWSLSRGTSFHLELECWKRHTVLKSSCSKSCGWYSGICWRSFIAAVLDSVTWRSATLGLGEDDPGKLGTNKHYKWLQWN